MKVETVVIGHPELGEQFNGTDHKLYVTTQATHGTYHLHVWENSCFKALNCHYNTLEELFARNSDIIPNRYREVKKTFEIGDIIYLDIEGHQYHILMVNKTIQIVCFNWTYGYFVAAYASKSLDQDTLLKACNIEYKSWRCDITE